MWTLVSWLVVLGFAELCRVFCIFIGTSRGPSLRFLGTLRLTGTVRSMGPGFLIPGSLGLWLCGMKELLGHIQFLKGRNGWCRALCFVRP